MVTATFSHESHETCQGHISPQNQHLDIKLPFTANNISATTIIQVHISPILTIVMQKNNITKQYLYYFLFTLRQTANHQDALME